jgi:[ribosomal protein S5]-alanine N-acetyltransferase
MSALPRLAAPLSDGQVTLREWTAHDTPALVDPLNEAEIARWTRVPSPYTEAHAEEFIHSVAQRRGQGEELVLAIVGAAAGQPLGSSSIRIESRDHARAELGYLVFEQARGQGVATRAVRLLTAYAFAELEIRRVAILVAVGNAASLRVAEKAGFMREGVLRSYMDLDGERRDTVSFSLLPWEL